jgi:hypothetical protein
MMVIHPYRYQGSWVFDDESVGLKREPFVMGVPAMIDALAATIPGAEDGFSLLFSAKPFPGFHEELVWAREEYEGNWYRSARFNAEGWLCPALLKYFDKAPEKIYVRFEPRQ